MTRQRALLLLMVIVFLSSFTGSLSLTTGMSLGIQLNRGLYRWMSYLIYSMPVFTYPIFSAWSDALGRRPFILIAMVFKLIEIIVIASTDSIVVLSIAQIVG